MASRSDGALTVTLDDQIAAVLEDVAELTRRLREVHTRRASEGKSIAPKRLGEAKQLRAALDGLINELPADANEVSALLAKLKL